jgi:phenylalanyl-tRNA synthetase alpha chain
MEFPPIVTTTENFDALGMDAEHPTRDPARTWYLEPATAGLLLRTHGSADQVRAMRMRAPGPMRAVAVADCYRIEPANARSYFQFRQLELVAVGPQVAFSDLLGLIETLLGLLLGPDWSVRFRPAEYAFASPALAADAGCGRCAGSGCSFCRGTGWLELGCGGLTAEQVLRGGGYDPDQVQGITFGASLERIAMLRHGIYDIRHFWRNDLRLLEQVRP